MRIALPSLAALALAAGASAQEGNYWDTLPLPGALTAPVVAFGTNITLRTATDLWVYSAVLRTWTQIPISPSAIVHSEYNDHVVVKDGTSVHGWSTRTGQVTTITVAPTATVVAGITGRTWTAAVIDGNTVHAYASFTGTWATITTASPPVVTLDKVTMLVSETGGVHALSAFYGDFVSSPAATVLTVSENSALTVDGSDVVRGFSALANTWTSHAFPGATGATLGLGFTYVLLQTATDVLGFSADTQSFAEYAAVATMGSLRVAPEAAAFRDGSQVACFSPSLCSFSTVPVSGTPAISPAENRFGSFVMIADGSDLHAFSGVTGGIDTLSDGPHVLTLSDASAFAQGASAAHAYSATLGAWSACPIATGGALTILYNGAIVTSGSSQQAYSARHGTWNALAQPIGTVAIHGSLYTTTSGNQVDLYDSRVGQWTSFTTTATPNPLSVWRLMTITHDGVNAYGFSLFSNLPSSVALQGTVQEYRANSEVAFVRTNTHVHVFTGVGSLTMLNRYPEHSRGQARGTPLFLQQTGPVGSVVRGSITPGVVRFRSGSLGTGVAYGIIPASGVLNIRLSIPPDPRLLGVQAVVRNRVSPPSAPAWTTNSVSPILL